MKKNYYSALMLLLFALCCSLKSYAQLPIEANDDTIDNLNVAQGSSYLSTFLENDTLNNNPVSTAVVSVTQISSTHPNVYVAIGGILCVEQGTPAGTYTIVYQICQNNFQNNCDTGTITVNVCNQPAPTYATQDCNSPADAITINGLPAEGTWTLTMSENGATFPAFTGTGTTFTIPNLEAGYYSFQVTNATGCTSPLSSTSLGYIDGLDSSLTGTYQDLNNDGIVNVGDIINYEITVINISPCEMTNVEVDHEEWGSTTIVFGSPIPSIAAGMSATVTAYYPITQADINNGGVIFNWFAVRGNLNGYQVYTKAFGEGGLGLTIPDGMKLNAFVDSNTNGIQDNNEVDFALGYFQYTINDSTAVQQLYNTNNPIIYETNPFNTYDVTFVIYPEYAAYYNLVTATHSDISIAGNPGITNYNFPITPTNYVDLAVHMYNTTTATPGFPYINYISYSNNSSQTIPSGTITFLSNTTFPVSVSETVTPNADGFTFNFTNLLPFETRTMMLIMDIPTIPTVALGDNVGNVASISYVDGDVVLENNISTVNTTIVGSYDPNDKAESHDGKILHEFFNVDDYLDYTIRFENTGTANAFTVKVTDVLDPKLDEASIRMVRASHNYVLEREGSELTWTFNNIQLPPSVPETQIGHGYIAFKVKPKPGYAIGDIIENTASIYFDFNPAIVTNTTSTEFVATLGTENFSTNEMKLYPNPVKNVVNIVSSNTIIESIRITDMLGKTVLNNTINSTQATLDVSGLATGMYVVKAISAQGEKSIKIVKE